MEILSKISSLNEWLSFRPEIAWLHLGADAVAFLAYLLILFAFVFFVKNRGDLASRRSFLFFGIFIFLAASLHLLALFAPWHRIYSLQIMTKLAVALFSLFAALLLWQWARKGLRFPAPHRFKELEDLLENLEESRDRLQDSRQELISTVKEKEEILNETREAVARALRESERLKASLDEAEETFQVLPALFKSVEEAQDFHSAIEMTLRKVCETTGWEYGEAWVPRADGKVLEYHAAWENAPHLEGFRQVSQELKFPPKIGFPGRIWSSKNPAWIPDLSKSTENDFLRRSKARECGFHSVFGVPVTAEGKVFAVLLFCLSQFSERGKRLAEAVSVAAPYLSSVIQRKRNEERLQEAHELLEKRIHERTGELLKVNQSLRDEIAVQQLREESVRRSQENFQTLVNSIEGIVWEYDLRGSRFTFVSQQAEKILGYPIESWFNEPSFWQDHVHGADREKATAFRERLARDKCDDQFEYRMITAGGKTIWLRDMVTVVVLEGETIKLRGVMVNITDQKQTEEALNQERNFVSAVLDTTSAMVMILDTEGQIVRLNRACEQISGYTFDEVKGKNFWDLFSTPEEAPQIQNVFARILAGQFPTNYESAWIAKDGTQRAIAWSNTALLNKYGSVVHVIATGVDVTKRREVEQKLKEAVSDLARSNEELDRFAHELKEANERLKKLDEMKSNFISAASHELRTPLTSLKGYVETILLEETGPINEKQREFLGYVKESTDRLHRLLNELLDISKIESGQVEMEMQRTFLRDLLKEEIMVFKPQADQKEISLHLEIQEGLQGIFCDADKIREVMDNLLSNAIKYTPRRGTVRIGARNKEGGVQIAVEDTGIGIKRQDLGRIFEPFQHIEKNGVETEESTGLGLTLVKRIIEAHQGEVKVRSEEGKGSTFTVFLPAGKPSMERRSKTHWAVTRE